MKNKRSFYNKSDKEFLQTITESKVLKECLTRKINFSNNINKSRLWTKEEYDFMVNNWGKLSKKEIADALGRTLNAICCKADRIGLRDYFIYSNYMTLNTLHKILFGKNLDSYTLGIWERYKMPFSSLQTNKEQNFKVIKIGDFISWFEKNKRVIDLSLTVEGCFGIEEPEWLKEKRQADKRAYIYTKPNRVWTEEEDTKLKELVKAHKYGYREISIILKRTEGALKRRFIDLNIKERPIKAENHNMWTPEEIDITKDLWLKGYQSCVIAEFLPYRSALAINGLLERYKYFGECPQKYKLERK